MIRQPHPWNRPLAETTARDLSRLPHALMLAGAGGLGKNDFALWLAQLLLCSQATPSSQACGACQSCVLFAAGTHADLHVVQPEVLYKNSESLLAKYAWRYPPEGKGKDSKDSTAIRIDQIRGLIESSQTRPQLARCKVLIISPAEEMNVNASNSLLKLLEEPPPDSFLLLVTHRPTRLAPTIRSRCSRLEFRAPDQAEAIHWLESQTGVTATDGERLLALSGGAPLEAQSLATQGFLEIRDELLVDLAALESGQGDPLAAATRWRQVGGDRCLAWLQGWVHDLIRLHLQPAAQPHHNPDRRPRLQGGEKRLDLGQLYHFADRVARSRRLGALDEQLLIEDTLIQWAEIHHRNVHE
jgi:DNA polymerase-3 subunit delta'